MGEKASSELGNICRLSVPRRLRRVSLHWEIDARPPREVKSLPLTT